MTRLSMAAATAALLTLPFWVVEIPPMTDLPQQLAQITLLREALQNVPGTSQDASRDASQNVPGTSPEPSPEASDESSDDETYRIQWWHPNKLGYVLLGVARLLADLLGDALLSARIAGALLVLSWVAALHAVAAAWRRPPEAAALASLFAFGHCTYWGFMTFQVGFPIFLVWLALLRRQRGADRPASVRWIAGLALGALALYSAHVFWLLAGLAWSAVDAMSRPGRRRRALATTRAATALPAVALVAWWYPTLERSGFTSGVYEGYSLLDRVGPSLLVPSALGGLRGPLEPTIVGAVALWIVTAWIVAAWIRSSSDADRGDRRLLGSALLLLAAYLVLPAVAQNTIFLASRWVAPAAALLVLAAPRLPVRPLLARALAGLLVASFALGTTNAWDDHDRDELAGLVPSLRALDDETGEQTGDETGDETETDPRATRLLGLDLVQTSPIVRDRPFYHHYAYAQVLHGVRLARSFAEESSSLVVYRSLPFEPPWTPSLDFHPERLAMSDFDHFEYALVHAPAELHEGLFERHPRLRPVTPRERWRLYRVVR